MTAEQKAEILRRYPHELTSKIAADLDLKVGQIYNLANNNGLKKDPVYLASEDSGRLRRGVRSSPATEFKKGQIPFNKGQKMTAEVYAKAKATMFQKGNRPANWKPDGTLSARPDKTGREYVHIKLSDSKWVLYHRYLWEQEHGPIPAKMKLAFINGNSLDCRLENLKLMTYAEAMQMNTWHRFTPEIKELIRLNNKLLRKINGKEQNQ
jgi:hypothetical protein